MSEETTGNTPDSVSQRPAGDIQRTGLRGRIVRSRDLLGDEDRVLINHNGRLYMLHSLAGGGLSLEALTSDGYDSGFSFP